MKLRWLFTSQLFASIDAAIVATSCCTHLLVKNARIGERIYTHNDRFVNGRPMYEDAHKVRAVWYNDGAWKSGYFDAVYPIIAHSWKAEGEEPKNSVTGNFDSAYMSSGEDTECPHLVTTWKTESDLTLRQPEVFGDLISLSMGEEDAPVKGRYIRDVCGTTVIKPYSWSDTKYTFNRDCNRESDTFCCDINRKCQRYSEWACTCETCVDYRKMEKEAYTNNWTVDSTISVSCYLPTMDCCEELAVTHRMGKSIRYNWTGELVNGRPVYTDSTGEQALWYNGPAWGTWAITSAASVQSEINGRNWPNWQNPVEGITNVLTVSADKSHTTCPNDVGVWREFTGKPHFGGEWEIASVEMICTDDSSGGPMHSEKRYCANSDECGDGGMCSLGTVAFDEALSYRYWACVFPYCKSKTDLPVGYCMKCDSLDNDNGCYKARFSSIGATQECMNVCTDIYHHEATRQLSEIIAKLLEVIAESLTGSKDAKFVKSMIKQVGKLPTKMEKTFRKTRCTFNFTTEIQRASRVDLSTDPCVATTQMLEEIKKWADTYNVSCKNGSKKAAEKIAKKADKLESKMHKRLKTC